MWEWVQDHLKLCHSLKIKEGFVVCFSFVCFSSESSHARVISAQQDCQYESEGTEKCRQRKNKKCVWSMQVPRTQKRVSVRGIQQLWHEPSVNLRELDSPLCIGLGPFCRNRDFCRHSWLQSTVSGTHRISFLCWSGQSCSPQPYSSIAWAGVWHSQEPHRKTQPFGSVLEAPQNSFKQMGA